MKDSIDTRMVEMLEKKKDGKLDCSEANDKADDAADAEDEKNYNKVLIMCPSLMLIPMKRETATSMRQAPF
jgi:hypothetical protein